MNEGSCPSGALRDRIDSFERDEAEAARAGRGARSLAAERSGWFDRVLGDLWRDAARREDATPATALVAVGGYGRAELSPRSDLDLLFLTDAAESPVVRRLADAVLYPLWDLKLTVGHAVRSPADSLALARRDFQTCTALLELRIIAATGAGAADLAHDLETGLRRWISDRGLSDFLADNRRAFAQRHERFGGSVHLLEPDVKQSPGGLRDLHTGYWAALARFGARDVASLLRLGLVSSRDAEALAAAEEFLLRLRAEMHRASGRKEDHLTYDLQDVVAPRLGYRGPDAAESCLRDYYQHARAIGRLVPDVLERAEPAKRGLVKRGPRPIKDSAFDVWNGAVQLRRQALAATDVVPLFAVSSREGLPIAAAARAEVAHAIAATSPPATAYRDALALLCDDTDTIRVVERLHDDGCIAWLIPEFREVECLIQRDLYHVFTVDAHLVFAVERLKEVFRGDWVEREPFFSALAQEVEHRDALVLAVLLHDVGKGGGGDHADRGAEKARAVSERFGLSARNVEHVVFLVLEHLRLMRTALRRDLEDADVIADVVRNVTTQERLRDLALLSFVDSSTTSPTAWTPWKSALLAELTERAALALGAGGVAASPNSQTSRLPSLPISGGSSSSASTPFSSTRRELSSDGIAEWTVRCDDRPGRLAMIAGAVSAAGIDILSARIFSHSTGSGVEIEDRIVVRVPSHISTTSLADDAWRRVEMTLARLLRGEMTLDELERVAAPPRGPLERASPRIETRVDIVNRASQRYSVVEVRCRDRRGLLFKIARAIAAQGANIALAKIATEGGRANDAFYVKTTNGEKIADPATFAAALRERIAEFVS